MTLSEYIKSFPRSKRMSVRKLIGRKLGISEIYVRSMCNGNKSIPYKYAYLIERATNGAVSRQVIAPQLFLID